MLIEFIDAHRGALIARARAKRARVGGGRPSSPTDDDLASGVPLFLDQLIDTLRHARASTSEAMDRSAAVHGAAMLARGYSAAQVVHDYGDVCQAITELAAELDAPITVDEFRTLNRCLDNGIAHAVTAYVRILEESSAAGETERVGMLAHELRNKLSAAQLAFEAIKTGRAPTNGSVAALLGRSLRGMTSLLSRALVEVRLDSGSARAERVDLARLIDDAGVEGTIEAAAHGVVLTVDSNVRGICVDADPQILTGALANLLQNGSKFTPAGKHVRLRARVAGARVEIDVEDECGGLPPGKAEELFGAFEQRGTNRTGLGLGLFISRKGIAACGGLIRVRDRPGVGCVFTVELPASSVAPNGAVSGA